MQRRRFLAAACAIGAVGIAGCNDEEAPAEDDPDDTNGVADDANGDDSANEGDTDPDDEGLADGDVDDANGENPRLRDVIAWEESYAIDFEFDEGSGNAVVHERDMYITWTVDGETVEVYHVDDETYTVVDDECFLQPMDTPEDELFDPEEAADDDEEYIATGTTTVDGEEVYEFDLDGGTLYVSVETGYPVRFDGDDGEVVTFHSWGETDPISPPDMECVEPGGERP